MVIFARPLPAVWQDEHPPARPAPISAITWKSYLQDGELALTVIGWTRRSALEGYRDPKLTIHYRGLAPVHAEALLYGIPPAELIGPAPLTKVLQSFAALCRTPLVRDETEPGSKAARQAAQRAGRPDPVIRRVYLRRPEHAQEELEAAREARAGAPKRGHWVRGHWKRQWHASIGEHSTIWISGYPRGDFTAGTVTGSKVLVASDRRELGKPSVAPSRAAAAQGFPSQLLINPTEQSPIRQGETPGTPNVRQARRK
ncbi:hypothetical protein AB0B10_25290 [Micromonospora arborensis]|uniref:hypothetical protein n=1 Tax=Micromonospora arborensis TaxID=2116518 RepID=UPI00340BCBCE